MTVGLQASLMQLPPRVSLLFFCNAFMQKYNFSLKTEIWNAMHQPRLIIVKVTEMRKPNKLPKKVDIF